MPELFRIEHAHDRPLFTPGPVTTSRTVKQAMLRDVHPADPEFVEIVQNVRRQLLESAGVSSGQGFECVLVPGTAASTLETVIGSVVPGAGKILVVLNGADGERLAQIAAGLKIRTNLLKMSDQRLPDLTEIDRTLTEDRAITHVAVAHCDTTSGILNPIDGIGMLARRHHKAFIVDANATLFGIPIDLHSCSADFVVCSSGQCLESVPGIGLVIGLRESLEAVLGSARSHHCDLHAQWKALQNGGPLRSALPSQAMLALAKALEELAAEGGVPARADRYRNNYQTLLSNMRAMGFTEYLDSELQSTIVTAFHGLDCPGFDFQDFHTLLFEKGFVLSPWISSREGLIRIGTIGRILSSDVRSLLDAIWATLQEMKAPLESPSMV